jgi:hypothetical protein
MYVEMKIFVGFQAMNIKLIQLIVGFRKRSAVTLSQ